MLWGRTKHSIAFDTLASTGTDGARETKFSQALTFTAAPILHDGEKFDLAVAPQATVFLRDETGMWGGAVAIARYHTGRNSLGATASWSPAPTVQPPTGRALSILAPVSAGSFPAPVSWKGSHRTSTPTERPPPARI